MADKRQELLATVAELERRAKYDKRQELLVAVAELERRARG